MAKFSKILPEKVGEFRLTRKDQITNGKEQKEEDQTSSFNRYYEFKSGAGIFVTIHKASSEDDAYSLWSFQLNDIPLGASPQKCEIGTACFRWERGIVFVKGTDVVLIDMIDARISMPINEKSPDADEAISTLANLISDNVEKGEGDVPALVKHLPDWENIQSKTAYIRTKKNLLYVWENKDTVPPVIDVVPFESGTEAIVANYPQGHLVIIEYSTPQIASDADQRITQKINELKSQNQPVPTAYKRVGNYSVFVFDAPDEATANNLINQVEYGKTVQWLNGDPYEYDRANRRYLMTAGNIIITVLKTSGIALLLCFAIGGGFGYFVFLRRRKQQATQDAFTDAGGMMRLNLDEMTPQTEPSRLLNKAGD